MANKCNVAAAAIVIPGTFVVSSARAAKPAVRFTAGVDYGEKTRNFSPVRVAAAREQTRELSFRAELRRSLNETLSGAFSFTRSNRDGSPFVTTVVSGYLRTPSLNNSATVGSRNV